MSVCLVIIVSAAAVVISAVGSKSSKAFLLPPPGHGGQLQRWAISWLGMGFHSRHHKRGRDGRGSGRSLQLDLPGKAHALLPASLEQFHDYPAQPVGWRWSWCRILSNYMCLLTSFSGEHVAFWHTSGQRRRGLAGPGSSQSAGQRDSFAAGAHVLLVWDGIDFQHAIQDPGWQWSGEGQFSERRWRWGSLDAGDCDLRGWCRPRAESPEQWEPEALHRVGRPAAPRAGRHSSKPRPLNASSRGKREACTQTIHDSFSSRIAEWWNNLITSRSTSIEMPVLGLGMCRARREKNLGRSRSDSKHQCESLRCHPPSEDLFTGHSRL